MVAVAAASVHVPLRSTDNVGAERLIVGLTIDGMEIPVALLTGFFALAGALGGVGLASWLQSRQEAARVTRENEVARRARIRDWQLEALRETRDVLIGQLTWLEQRVILKNTQAPTFDAASRTRFNINLVGEAGVIQRYTEVLRDLTDRLPMTWGQAARQLLPRSLADLDADLLERTTKVRAAVLKALDQQETRALRDEPLNELSAEDLATIAGADAMLDSLRDRQRQRRSSAPDR